MYKIIYKKSNGEIIERTRSTLPIQSVGEYTSMNWLILDILHCYNKKYYTFSEYKQLMTKFKKRNKIKRTIHSFIKKYAVFILYIPFVTIFFIK